MKLQSGLRSCLPGAMFLGLCTAMPSAQAVTFGGSAAFTSDYVWRGSSQNQGNAAVQGGLKASADNGLYGSLWGSSVDFGDAAGASTEMDFVAGWSGSLAPDWALDVNFTRYQYPGSKADLDWNEVGATVTWKRNYWLQLGVSDDALASGRAGSYAQIGARLPVNDALRFEALAGHYWLDSAYADDYTHGQVSAVWAFARPCELRVSGHFTDDAARRLFPGQAGSRLEVALQASF
ncbi:TorF family putative porin [[Pseudomonas] boreopolis]